MLQAVEASAKGDHLADYNGAQYPPFRATFWPRETRFPSSDTCAIEAGFASRGLNTMKENDNPPPRSDAPATALSPGRCCGSHDRYALQTCDPVLWAFDLTPVPQTPYLSPKRRHGATKSRP